MKIFRNWKELNEPRFTSIGAIGLMAFGSYLQTTGLKNVFFSSVVAIVIVIKLFRDYNDIT